MAIKNEKVEKIKQPSILLPTGNIIQKFGNFSLTFLKSW
jgi:hypothetical protein